MPKQKTQLYEDLFREGLLEDSDPPRREAALSVAKVHRRGNDAVLDSDDCEIIVYELFGDRA